MAQGGLPTQVFPQEFVSGHANPFAFQVLGQTNVATLNIKSSSWDEEINMILVTHSGSGGIAARLANVLDGHGTIACDLDLLAPPYMNPPLIIPGISGLALYYIAPTRSIQIPVMVGKVHYEGQVQGQSMWTFDIAMNSLAGQYIRPTS